MRRACSTWDVRIFEVARTSDIGRRCLIDPCVFDQKTLGKGESRSWAVRGEERSTAGARHVVGTALFPQQQQLRRGLFFRLDATPSHVYGPFQLENHHPTATGRSENVTPITNHVRSRRSPWSGLGITTAKNMDVIHQQSAHWHPTP